MGRCDVRLRESGWLWGAGRRGWAFAGWGWLAALLPLTLLLIPGSRPRQAFSVPETPEKQFIGPGVTYRELVRPEGPQVVQVVSVIRREKLIQLGASLAGRRVLGLATVSDQAAAASSDRRTPIAAVNGDFFAIARGPYQGMPIGGFLLKTPTGDEIVRTPYPRTALVIEPGGGLDMRIVRWHGSVKRPDGAVRRLDGVNEYRKRAG